MGRLLAVSLLATACGDVAEPEIDPAVQARFDELERRLWSLEQKVGDGPSVEPAGPAPAPAPPTQGITLTGGAPAPLPPSAALPPPSAPPRIVGDAVTLFIRTAGVTAQIIDADQDIVLGETNVRGGIQVARREMAMNLILRAEGRQDVRLQVVPNRDKAIVQDMK